LVPAGQTQAPLWQILPPVQPPQHSSLAMQLPWHALNPLKQMHTPLTQAPPPSQSAFPQQFVSGMHFLPHFFVSPLHFFFFFFADASLSRNGEMPAMKPPSTARRERPRLNTATNASKR